MNEPAVAQPIIAHYAEEIVLRSVQIIDARTGGRVITTIEVLSPTNKSPGRGRGEYLRKQDDALSASVNIVEIDLLRSGETTTLSRKVNIDPERITTYHACVSRARFPDRVEYYPVSLRQRLPRLPIPLRPTDSDVVLDMQAVVNQAYERGRYGEEIDYTRPLSPPLSSADTAWAEEILRGPARSQASSAS